MNKMKFQRNQSIPLSQEASDPTIRRRLSSLSLKSMQNLSSPATEWALRRSKSVSAMSETAGISIAKWWSCTWDWILSRKPAFAIDLEMSSEETALLGSQNKGSWRHVLYKLTSEIRRIVGTTDNPKFQPKYQSPTNYFRNFESKKHVLPH